MKAKQRHLPSSPFKPKPEPVVIELFVGDRISHDSYGLGRVVQADANAVMIDFGSQTVRVVSPFAKVERL